MSEQAIELSLALARLLLQVSIAPTTAGQNNKTKHEYHQKSLGYPLRRVARANAGHKGLPPSAAGLLFLSFFAQGLAGLFAAPFRAVATCFRQSWHTGHSPAAVLTRQLRPRPLAAADLSHHGAHLVELYQQLIHVMDIHSASGGDPFAAAPIDDVGIVPFLSRHRQNNGLDVLQMIAFQRLLHLRHRGEFIEAWH